MSESAAVRVCPQHNLVLEERGELLICPAPRRHRAIRWTVVDRRKGRALYEADKEGTRRIMNEKAAVGEPAQPKSQTLERAKFEDGTRLVLFIRLTKEPKRWGGDPFRIRWMQGQSQGLGKKGTLAGVAKTCADEASAREAFKAAVRSAIGQGWKPIPIGMGGPRSCALKPIPAPRKRAA
jgi:hypothetical protein